MSTGPEHYKMAQDWLQTAWDMHNGGRPDTATFYLHAARAHATLALAAATALRGFTELPVPDAEAWLAAAGGQPVEYSEARPDYDPDAQ